MRGVFGAAPAWVRSVIQASIFFTGWTLYSRFGEHVTWFDALVGGAVFGTVMTVFIWFAERRQRREIGAITDALTPEQRAVAFRAAHRGPVPDDPAVHRTAVRIARRWLDESTRGRILSSVVMVGFTVLSAGIAMYQSAWYWFAAAFFLAALVVGWAQPRRLERRLDTLLAAERQEAAARARAPWSRLGESNPGQPHYE